MFDDDAVQRWVARAAGVAYLAVVGFLIVDLHPWSGWLSRPELPGRLQAAGAVLALFVAIYVGHAQTQRQIDARQRELEDQDRESRRVRIDRMEGLTFALRHFALQIDKVEAAARRETRRSFSLR